ncbi:hypothetical protein [Marinagarivorans algicola]|uniref:hypothetical protein n=1 Tax=Marinagarivorans algicola TaxID=1513270 RepID=UPI0006B46D80|nr:hypothetical protein [Marinagarivorans algicola]
MESEKFDLVFSGQILPRQELETVKANMAALFKISSAQVKVLFSGKTIVLKRNIDLTAANRYRVAIKKAGARVDLLKAGTASTQVAAKAAEKAAASTHTSTQASAGTRADVNGEANANAVSNSPPATPPQAPRRTPQAPVAKKTDDSRVSLEALPVGEGLLAPSTDSPTTVVVPDFEVLDSGSDLLSEHEKAQVAPLNIDLSAITVRELGPLVDDTERVRMTSVTVTELQADILPAGSDLLQDSERPRITPANIQALDLDIAPVGARLNSDKPPAPAAPNVDHIALADD